MMSTVLQVGFSLGLNIPPTSGLLHLLYLCPGNSPFLLGTPTHPLNFSSNITSSGKPSLTTTPSPNRTRSLSAYRASTPSLSFSFIAPTVCNVTGVIAGFPRLQVSCFTVGAVFVHH